MTGSFVIKIIAVLLSVLPFSVATLGTAVITVPDDSSQTYQDDAGSLALIGLHVLLPPYKAETYFSYEEQEAFHQALLIFRHTSRGPPTLC